MSIRRNWEFPPKLTTLWKRSKRMLLRKAKKYLIMYPQKLLLMKWKKSADKMLHHKANLNGYLAYHTGQSLDQISQDTDNGYLMSAEEAKEYGLIDGVIMNPLKKTIKC